VGVFWKNLKGIDSCIHHGATRGCNKIQTKI
jgi:hypothetical protein